MPDLADKLADYVLRLALEGDEEAQALTFTAFCDALLQTDIPEMQFNFDGQGYMVEWWPNFRYHLTKEVEMNAP